MILGLALGAYLSSSAWFVAYMLITGRRPVTPVDVACGRVDQELDAQQQLRTQRTVHAEPIRVVR